MCVYRYVLLFQSLEGGYLATAEDKDRFVAELMIKPGGLLVPLMVP